jgi:hypothetical protein
LLSSQYYFELILGGDVDEATALFEPTVEVRDVVESYLANDVIVSDWRERLRWASTRLTDIGQIYTNREVVELGQRVAALVVEGLEHGELTKSVGANVERLLDRLRVPGLPRPEESHWEF